MQVDGPAAFERVSGSSIGGGTYWGLCRLLTGASSYDESLKMASKGESDKADMLVGDIYGRGYSKFQLSSKTLASSFGKIGGMEAPRGPDSGVGEEDLARSLLVMITMNIGQVCAVYIELRFSCLSSLFLLLIVSVSTPLSREGVLVLFALFRWTDGSECLTCSPFP